MCWRWRGSVVHMKGQRFSMCPDPDPIISARIIIAYDSVNWSGCICFTVQYETSRGWQATLVILAGEVRADEFALSHQIWLGIHNFEGQRWDRAKREENKYLCFSHWNITRGVSRAENLTYFCRSREIKRKKTEKERPWEREKTTPGLPPLQLVLHRAGKASNLSSFSAPSLWPHTPPPFLFCSAIYSAF